MIENHAKALGTRLSQFRGCGLNAAEERLGRAPMMPQQSTRTSSTSSCWLADCRDRVRKTDQAGETSQALARMRTAGITIGAAVAACLSTPALAESKPSTRLVSCGADSCLLVTGQRKRADAEVQINGHPVVVQGKRSWRVRLPVSTVREWSTPFARKIEVSSYNPAVSAMASHSAKLPIGLLGHVPDLASLVITLN